MSDIFLSYAREDVDQARQLVEVLDSHGWSIFWDRDIPPGMPWREFLESKINAARCVIVLWSSASVASSFVLNEALLALDRRSLVPVCLQAVQPPFGFRHLHTADLTNWDGRLDHDLLLSLLEVIAERLAPPESTPVESLPLPSLPVALPERELLNGQMSLIGLPPGPLPNGFTGR